MLSYGYGVIDISPPKFTSDIVKENCDNQKKLVLNIVSKNEVIIESFYVPQ